MKFLDTRGAVEAALVRVEVDAAASLPAFTTVGHATLERARALFLGTLHSSSGARIERCVRRVGNH